MKRHEYNIIPLPDSGDEPIFADAANHTCEAGPYILRQADISEPFASGEFGAGLTIFEA